MADVLTQLQDCLEQLSNQFTASLNYINLHAPPGTFSTQPNPPPGSPQPTITDPSQTTQTPSTTLTQSQNQTQSQTAPRNLATNSTALTSQSQTQTAPSPNPANAAPPEIDGGRRPPSPATFAAAQQELAQDLIKKTQQIEELMGTLPGLGRSQEAQETRIAGLEEELKAVEVERRVALGEREEAIEVLERIVGGVRR